MIDVLEFIFARINIVRYILLYLTYIINSASIMCAIIIFPRKMKYCKG